MDKRLKDEALVAYEENCVREGAGEEEGLSRVVGPIVSLLPALGAGCVCRNLK